jgi:hypothetical protein
MTTVTDDGATTAKKASVARKAKSAETGLPFAAEGSGVGVEREADGSFVVTFAYNPRMVAEMRAIEGAAFSRDKLGWVVPAERVEALTEALTAMRSEAGIDRDARAEILVLAKAAALQLHAANGITGVQPMTSDFIVNSGEHSGQIIALNGRYAAQFNGFGKQDGAAFVTLHQLDRIGEQIFKGDRVSIDYSETAFKGAKVTHIRTKEERVADFEANMGRNVDGVRVVAKAGKFHVEFDYNPVLSERIARIDGAEFDKAAKHWTVGTDKKSFLVNAVIDMREEVVADKQDRAAMEAVAASKIDGVKVRDAFTKNGHADSGKILAKSNRYVLQHTGKECAVLHRTAALPYDLEIGKSARIEYQKGKGKITERGLFKGVGR